MKLIYQTQFPLKTVSEANCHEHWTVKYRRHKKQKKFIWAILKRDRPKISLPCLIKLKRIGKRKLDSDNLQMSLKWIRDAVADTIFPGQIAGKADDSDQLSWEYSQEVSSNYEVSISIYSLDKCCVPLIPNELSDQRIA